jgi:transposase
MESFYLGIDVSKGYADFVIVNSQRHPVVENFQLDDTYLGHQCLYSILNNFLDKHPKSALYAGVESTGGYENNWYNKLIEFQGLLNIQTARLNPLGVMHNSKADLKRIGTDKISAQNVAEYLIAHPDKVRYQQDDQLAGLRKMWGFIQMLKKQSTQLLNQLESLLYTANPELLSFCQDGVPQWVLRLLIKYPTAAKLKRARVGAVAKIPYVTMPRAQKLIDNAKRSIASAADAITANLIAATARQILHLKYTIAGQRDRMEAECDSPQVELLKTFQGIGYASAIGLILELQTIARFEGPKKLASYWGVHPVYKVSGDGVGGFKMSKQGRKEPRSILYTVTLSAIVCNPVIQPLYERLQKQGKHNMDAIGVCMHKIVRIIYGMLKNNKSFDPEIDKANRKRMAPKKPADPKKGPDRRYQEYDPSAPISRNQRNKRLEQEQSLTDKNSKPRLSTPVPIGDVLADVLSNL